MIYRETIDNLIGGVSQQAKWIRFDNQVDELVNGLISVTDGLVDRPPFRHDATLVSAIPVGRKYHSHHIKRDADTQFIVLASDDSIQVWDLDGTAKTVNVTAPALDYLDTGGDPKKNLHMETIGDTTFVLNKTVTVAQSSATTSSDEASAIAWVVTGDVDTTLYKVTLNYTLSGSPVSVSAAFTTPTTPAGQLKTDYIAAQLKADFDSQTAFTDEFTCEVNGSVLKIDIKGASTATDWSITHEDGLGNNGIKVFNQETALFEELPPGAPDGTVIKVSGNDENDFKPYFVTFRDGAWEETIAPSEPDGLDETTMPHVLIQETDGTFSFKSYTWTDRTVGNLETNPLPSFVGQKIRDIFFVRDRLGFLAGTNVVMSRTRFYEDFFRITVQTRLADDPIDVTIRSSKVSDLNHAVPFNETLLLVSQTSQFELAKADILTQETAAFNQTTEYAADDGAKPQGTGRDVYFLTPSGSNTAVQEYRVFNTVEAQAATNVSEHVPRYIPANIVLFAANPADGTLALVSSDDPSTIYVYRQYSYNNQKLISAWSKWTREDNAEVEGLFFENSSLYTVMRHTSTDQITLEELDMDLARTDSGMPWQIRMDRLVSFGSGDGVYDSVAEKTTFTLPGALEIDSYTGWMAITGAGTETAGQSLAITHETDTTFSVPGDWSAQALHLGRTYEHRVKLNELVLKEGRDNGAKVPVHERRLSVQRMTILLSDTGYLRAEVSMPGNRQYEYVFTGYILGSSVSLLGEVPSETTEFRFPIRAKSDRLEITLINDTAFPSQILGGSWEGRIHARATKRRPQ